MEIKIYNYQNRDVSLCLMRKERYKGDKIAPVFWRLTHNRKRKYLMSGFEFSKDEWLDFCNKKLLKHKDAKITLANYMKTVLIPAIDSLVEAEAFSFDGMEGRLGRSNVISVNDAFRKRKAELYAEDRIKYAESFESTLRSLETFKGRDIRFNSITSDFLRKYEKYLIDQGKSITTVGIYMRNIRTIINGDGEPYLPAGKYPFGKNKYIIPKGEGREMALRLDEIHLLQSYPCDGQRELYRDMWLFSFYGNGINMTDICRLKYEDIRDGEITFIRKKTQKNRRTVLRIFVPITRPVKDMIDKHGNKNKEGYIFPFLNGYTTEKQRVRRIGDITQYVNDTIRDIAKELNLPEGITTYATRHSYVTILERLNVPRIFIQNSLGHANESVTDSYSKMAEKELRFKYNSLLLPKSNEEVVKSLAESAKTELAYN